MKRLTFDGLFCDIAQCKETPGGTFCENGSCSQRKVWERLKEYEDLEEQGRLVVLPCKVGDTVFRLITPKDAPAVICEKPIRTIGEAADLIGRLGKKRLMVSVFASREEAERAMEGGTDNG